MSAEQSKMMAGLSMPPETEPGVILHLVAKHQKNFEELCDGIAALRSVSYQDEVPVLPDVVYTLLNRDKHFAIAAVLNTRVVGFIICKTNKKGLRLLDMLVLEDLRRGRIATDMLGYLVAKMMAVDSVTFRISAVIPERDLSAQMFLQAFGFLCTEICYYDDDGDDGYLFELDIPTRHKK